MQHTCTYIYYQSIIWLFCCCLIDNSKQRHHLNIQIDSHIYVIKVEQWREKFYSRVWPNDWLRFIFAPWMMMMMMMIRLKHHREKGLVIWNKKKKKKTRTPTHTQTHTEKINWWICKVEKSKIKQTKNVCPWKTVLHT